MNNIPHIVDTGASVQKDPEEPNTNISDTLIMASTDALLYGCGFVRITNHPNGMTVSRISKDQWLETAEQLKWMAEQKWVDNAKP